MNSYDTEQLLGVVNGFDPFDPFILNMFFSRTITFETSSIDIDVVAPNMQLAPFVSPMVSGKADKTQQSEIRKFKPAYVKPKDVIDPEQVISRMAGESIGGSMRNIDRRDAIIGYLLDKQRKNIIRRWEWMAVQAMLNAKVTIAGEDYPEVEVDFRRDAANQFQLTGTDVWTDLANAKPMEQFEEWNAIAEAPITDIIMDGLAWSKLYKFQEIKDLIKRDSGSASQMEIGPDNSKWASHKGMLGSFNVWVYSGYYKDDAGVKQKFIPDNTVIASSAATEGVRAFGAILDPMAGYQALEIFPKIWVNEDPGVEFAMSQSAPLMVPAEPNATVSVTIV